MALYPNGRAPAGILMRLPDTPNLPDGRAPMALAGPVIDLYLMLRDYHRETGDRIPVNDLYRDLAAQHVMLRRYGRPRAAWPGTSNHGRPDKQATDLEVGDAGSNRHRWLQRNARRYGFEPDCVAGEPWHLEHWYGIGAKQSWNRYFSELLGAETVKIWQAASGTPADGVISAPESALIRRSQEYSNATYGTRLDVDGRLGPATISAIQTDIRAKAIPTLRVDGLPGEGTRAGIRTLLGIS